MEHNVEKIFKESSSVLSKVALFNKFAKEHHELQQINPFTHQHVATMSKKTFSKAEYGHAPAGSLSEARSVEAQKRILHDIVELCEQIHKFGNPAGAVTENGVEHKNVAAHNDDVAAAAVDDDVDAANCVKISITFGKLFELYNQISDKLVGILLRARKYQCVHFEGEMLFQRRDDNVTITLLKDIEEIRNELQNKIQALQQN